MVQRTSLLVVILIMVYATTWAQKTNKIQYMNRSSMGILVGGSDRSMSLQTINGISYKTYSAGIGIGIDYYHTKTIPVFVDLKKNIFNRQKTPFVYLDLGYSLPSDSKVTSTNWWKTDISEFGKGYYYDAGIGYQFPVKGRVAIQFSLGYNLKQMSEDISYEYDARSSIWYTERNTREHYDYSFRRLHLKFGLGF